MVMKQATTKKRFRGKIGTVDHRDAQRSQSLYQSTTAFTSILEHTVAYKIGGYAMAPLPSRTE